MLPENFRAGLGNPSKGFEDLDLSRFIPKELVELGSVSTKKIGPLSNNMPYGFKSPHGICRGVRERVKQALKEFGNNPRVLLCYDGACMAQDFSCLVSGLGIP